MFYIDSVANTEQADPAIQCIALVTEARASNTLFLRGQLCKRQLKRN